MFARYQVTASIKFSNYNDRIWRRWSSFRRNVILIVIKCSLVWRKDIRCCLDTDDCYVSDCWQSGRKGETHSVLWTLLFVLVSFLRPANLVWIANWQKVWRKFLRSSRNLPFLPLWKIHSLIRTHKSTHEYNPPIGIMIRLITNDPGDWGSILVHHTKDWKHGTWCLLA